MSHWRHAIASRPRSSRRPGSGAVVWTTDSPCYPATRPAKSSPGWRTPSSPPPSPAGSTVDNASPTNPAAHSASKSKITKRPPHAGHPIASPAGAIHTGSPRRQARPAARGSQQGHAHHRRRRPQRRDRPHKSSATSSNRYINGRSAYSASTTTAYLSPEIIGDYAPTADGEIAVAGPRRTARFWRRVPGLSAVAHVTSAAAGTPGGQVLTVILAGPRP